VAPKLCIPLPVGTIPPSPFPLLFRLTKGGPIPAVSVRKLPPDGAPEVGGSNPPPAKLSLLPQESLSVGEVDPQGTAKDNNFCLEAKIYSFADIKQRSLTRRTSTMEKSTVMYRSMGMTLSRDMNPTSSCYGQRGLD
jgi:hypothetical protein